MSSIIKNMNIKESCVDTSFKIDESDSPIFVHIDIDKNRKGLSDEDTIIFIYEDEKYSDTFSLIYDICLPEIKKYEDDDYDD